MRSLTDSITDLEKDMDTNPRISASIVTNSCCIRGVELPGVRDGHSIRAEFEKTQVVARRRAVRLEQARIRERRARGIGARALRHIALRHAARVIDADERDAR